MLSLESYAEVLAHITHFGGDRGEEVRERLGLDERAWAKADQHWVTALSADADTEDKQLVLTFGTRFVATSEILARDTPAIENIEPLFPSAQTSRPAEFVSVDETSLGVFPIVDEPLPFGDEPSPEFVRALRDGVDSTRMEDALEMTSFMPALGVEENHTLPFADVSGLDLDDDLDTHLALEQYASLAAELAQRGADAPRVLARYGLAGNQYESVRRAWERRFEHQPEERRRWHQLLAQYAAWLEQRG